MTCVWCMFFCESASAGGRLPLFLVIKMKPEGHEPKKSSRGCLPPGPLKKMSFLFSTWMSSTTLRARHLSVSRFLQHLILYGGCTFHWSGNYSRMAAEWKYRPKAFFGVLLFDAAPCIERPDSHESIRRFARIARFVRIVSGFPKRTPFLRMVFWGTKTIANRGFETIRVNRSNIMKIGSFCEWTRANRFVRSARICHSPICCEPAVLDVYLQMRFGQRDSQGVLEGTDLRGHTDSPEHMLSPEKSGSSQNHTFSLRSGQSTVGGPKWTKVDLKLDQNGLFWMLQSSLE